MDLALRSTLPAAQAEARASILDLQDCMLKQPQVDLPVLHHFANGVYGREMFIPAGVTVVGKIHRFSCVNIIAQGRVRVVTEFGQEEYSAPDVFVSIPGSKRAVYAIEDTTWVTCHPCETTDLEQIEENLIAPSYDKLLGVV
jgi:hypothetical protein